MLYDLVAKAMQRFERLHMVALVAASAIPGWLVVVGVWAKGAMVAVVPEAGVRVVAAGVALAGVVMDERLGR